MSWLGRLLGRPDQPTASPSPRTAAIPDDLVAALTADGRTLDDAVEQTLRAHLAAEQEQQRQQGDQERRIPFWLAREADERGDIEQELRERMAQRRTAEEGEGEVPSRRTEPTRAQPQLFDEQ